MKFALPKNLLTEARWDILTVLFVSLTGMVGIIYAVIFAYPHVLPAPLQVPTKTPTMTSPAVAAVRATRPFPTFPAEWTAVFATRQAQSPTGTPTPLASGRSPALSSTLTLTTNLTVSPIPGLPRGITPTATLMLGSPISTSSSPIAPAATATLTPTGPTPLPSPDTPEPTASPLGYPTGYPGQSDPAMTFLPPYPPP